MGSYYSDSPRELPPLVHDKSGGRQPVILVVDDELTVLRVVESILDFAGYQVLVAASEPEALSAARHFPDKIELLITDVVLKAGSGPALARHLRSARPDIPVIYMSGYLPEDCLGPGDVQERDFFVSKPLAVHGILNLVAGVLRRAA